MSRISNAYALRKSELLEISITEVLFILIFVLLVYTHFAEREKKVEVDLLNNEIINLEKKTSKLERDNANLKKENRRLGKELQEWKENFNALKTVIEKYISDAGTLTPKEIADKLNFLLFALNAGSGDKKAVVDELVRLKSENRKLREEIQDLKKKIAELQRLREKESGGGGLDKPRCIVSGYPGIINFLFEITMYPNSYSIKALWDESYDSAFAVIPGIKEFSRINSLSRAEFLTAADRIYRWGEGETPKCRFFVEVLNNMGDVRSSVYQRQFGNIERRFYIRKKGWK